ncbi:MAG TPA: hypothetical protein VG077_11750 [Verrucomicrobiae bacterium]|nr:hypothetical protein [Verrucomicrobiae bacterium]
MGLTLATEFPASMVSVGFAASADAKAQTKSRAKIRLVIVILEYQPAESKPAFWVETAYHFQRFNQEFFHNEAKHKNHDLSNWFQTPELFMDLRRIFAKLMLR